MKKFIKPMALLLIMMILCVAPAGSILTMAQNMQKEHASASTYDFTVIEDEDVPLSNGKTTDPMTTYMLYTGGIAIIIGAVAFLKIKAERRKVYAVKEQEVAEGYMDDLIH